MMYENKRHADFIPKDNIPLADLPVAMAYVPWQDWGQICDLDTAFHVGTIFKDLNKPFLGCK